MGISIPENTDDLVYFTRRTIGEKGKIMAWAYRAVCEKCGKGKMGKPVEKGRVKIRASEYVCNECGHTEEKSEHEPKLVVEVKYTCPHCGEDGEAETEYKRRSFMGVKAYVFKCASCGENIGITKKMKDVKR